MHSTFKKFIQIYSALAISLVVIALWFLYTWTQNHLSFISTRQQSQINQIANVMGRDMYGHASDARYLARLTMRYNEHDHDGLEGLEDFYADFSSTRDFYFNIRYLDSQGRELVRIDRSYIGPVITPPDGRQNKAARYYFQEAGSAEPGDVYISKFDLNMEYGKLEKPYRPTLRFACPVVGPEGERSGLVVLNFEGKALLDEIRSRTRAEEGVALVSDADGYWILGPTEEEEWGNAVEERREFSVKSRFPEAWSLIANQKKGQFQIDDGLFTFNTVAITPDAIMPENGSPQSANSNGWKVFTWVPAEQLVAPWRNFYLSVVAVLLGLIALGSWQVADNRAHQDEIESLLRENEERIMAISQSSQDAIVMLDNRDRVVHWNPSAAKMFGYDSTEVMGLELRDMLAPSSDHEGGVKEVKEYFDLGEGKEIGNVVELFGIHRDGSRIPIELATSSFMFKGEWYSVGSMRDITERLVRQRELKRSEETSRALINAPIESAMLIGLNGTIEAINEVGAHRMGGSVDELIGENAFKRIAKDFVQRGREIVIEVQNTGQQVTVEAEREERFLLINAYPVRGSDGAVDRLAIFVRDVTEQRLGEIALKYSENRFRDVSEAVGEIIWETDPEGLVEFVTEDIESVLGYRPADIIGRPFSTILPDEDVDDYEYWKESIYERREPFSNTEFRTIDGNGDYAWLLISGTPYLDEDGEFHGFRGAAMDITERKAAEVAVKASERKLRALAESAYDAIVMIDDLGRTSFWNDAAEQLFGYTEGEVLGRDIHPLIAPPEDAEQIRKGMEYFAQSGTGPAVGATTEMVAVRKDGTRFEVERSISSFRLEGSWYAVATIRDITERKATEAKLLELATTDSLTGLYNRRRFMELSGREFIRSQRYGRPLAMFMLDIDHFKNVNDQHGHDVGDKVLQSMSETAVLALRGADILGRLGGEEFGVLLPETSEADALDVAERLRLSVERTSISSNGDTINITVSIGVSILEGGMADIDALLKKADVALYEAKHSGRNKVVLG